MTERDWADRFTREVDDLLLEAERADSPPRSAEYEQALEVARMLAETDFSDESKVHGSLKRQLLSLIESEGEVRSEAYGWLSSGFAQLKHRPVVLMGGVFLVLILALAVSFPESIAAAAQGAFHTLQYLVLGENSAIMQVDSISELPPYPIADPHRWSISTEIGNFGGNLPPGYDITIRSYSSLAEAEQQLDRSIRTPAFLPAGFQLRDIKLTPSGAPVYVFLFYSGPGSDIILEQHLLGERPIDKSDDYIGIESGSVTVTETVSTTFSMVVTDETVEKLRFNGQPGVWIGGNRLVWEHNSMGYTVGGLDLTLEEAIDIAESIQ